MARSTSDAAVNPGQQRKIRIIEKTFGENWRDQHPNMAIDAVYNIAINDDRKSLFCKIDRLRKDKLNEMLDHYDVTMGEFIGRMIDLQYEQYQEQRRSIVTGIADDYSG